MTRIFAALRLARQHLRSAAMRTYLRIAYRGIRCGRDVEFGRGVRVRAFAGAEIEIGPGTRIAEFALIVAQHGRLTIGAGCFVGRGATLVCRERITIGDGALLAEYVTVRDQDHRHAGDAPLAEQGFVTAPITIGHDVWIGAKATVTRGVDIAPHAVVAAHAVVTRSVSGRSVVAGIPARPIAAVEPSGGNR